MKRTVPMFTAGLICALLTTAPIPVLAQDPAPTETDAEEKKPGFFGNRFALFVDVAAGTAQLEDVNATVRTSSALLAVNTLSFDDHDNVKASIGWQLPFDRGYLELVFDGYRENGYSMVTTGRSTSLAEGSSTPIASEPVSWWFVDVANGNWSGGRFPPSWNEATDDANGNGEADPDEVRYPDSPDLTASEAAPVSLQNNFQTIDLDYRRGFGGRRVSGVWSAGLRYFRYDGNVLAPVWLGAIFNPGEFSDGALYKPISYTQRTTGVGPMGSLGVVAHFFRDRFQVYGEGLIAFVLQNMETDTGAFYTLTREAGALEALLPIPARLQNELSKDVWQLTGQIGVRFRIVDGLSVRLEYFYNTYTDAILFGDEISIPQNPGQGERGTAALYTTKDLKMDGFRLGFRYQF